MYGIKKGEYSSILTLEVYEKTKQEIIDFYTAKSDGMYIPTIFLTLNVIAVTGPTPISYSI